MRSTPALKCLDLCRGRDAAEQSDKQYDGAVKDESFATVVSYDE